MTVDTLETPGPETRSKVRVIIRFAARTPPILAVRAWYSTMCDVRKHGRRRTCLWSLHLERCRPSQGWGGLVTNGGNVLPFGYAPGLPVLRISTDCCRFWTCSWFSRPKQSRYTIGWLSRCTNWQTVQLMRLIYRMPGCTQRRRIEYCV